MSSPRSQFAFFFLIFTILTASAEEPGPWPQWRGPSNDGFVEAGDYPTRLGEDTLLWKTALPGKGSSTPIVLGETVFITAPMDGEDALLAFDRSGELIWSATFGPEASGKHKTASGCNASPVTDGDAVFVYFKSGELAAVDLDGTIRWRMNIVERYGEDKRFWDHGTSPVLTEEHVVFTRMHAGESWLAAFDKVTGELAWKVDRTYETPVEGDECYTTPLVIEYAGQEALLVWGAMHLTLHDAADGRVIWSCGGFNPDQKKLWPAIAMPVIVDDMIILCYGRNDRGDPRLHGVRLEGEGDVSSTARVWDRKDTGAFVPTPALADGKIYLLRDKGEIECVDPATGDTIWFEEFPRGRGNFYASPLLTGETLYAAREGGAAYSASIADDQFELLSEFDLEEQVIGSPVPAWDCILIRGEESLYCFGTK
jgi:outer membrane protein assembly factor BamB